MSGKGKSLKVAERYLNNKQTLTEYEINHILGLKGRTGDDKLTPEQAEMMKLKIQQIPSLDKLGDRTKAQKLKDERIQRAKNKNSKYKPPTEPPRLKNLFYNIHKGGKRKTRRKKRKSKKRKSKKIFRNQRGCKR